MPTELLEQPITDSPKQADPTTESASGNKGAKSTPDVNSKKHPRALVDGYDNGIGQRAEPLKYPEAPHGREKKRKTEVMASEKAELFRRFGADFRLDLVDLINDRRDFNSDAEFYEYLRESGHSYYVELFDKLTVDKEGADGRYKEVDDEALAEFGNTERGAAQIFKLKQVKLQEKAIAAAAAFSENPASPEPAALEHLDTRLVKGGVFREAVRGAGSWLRKERGYPAGRGEGYGRPAKIIMGTNGRLTLSIGTLSIAMGSIGGAAGGLPGAVVGVLGAQGVVALSEAFKKGVSQELDLNANALQSLIGNPNSDNVDSRVQNDAKIQWMRKRYRLDATDYAVQPDGTVARREGIVGMTGVDRVTLAQSLAGEAHDITEFQGFNGIPSDHQQIMDASWIYQGTTNRPQQGTHIEARLFEAFNPDQAGIQNVRGQHPDRLVYQRPPREIIPADTLTADRTAGYDTDVPFPQRHFAPGDEMPPGTQIPAYDDTAGNHHDARVTTTREPAPTAFDAPRVFGTGDPLPVGTVIPEFFVRTGRRGDVRRIPERRVNRPGERADHNFAGFQRYLQGDTIPAGTHIPDHWGWQPGNAGYILDSHGQPVGRYERNPGFDWDDINALDFVANARHWDDAVEKVLTRENEIIFQSLIDGNADYRDRAFRHLKELKIAAKTGPTVGEARRKMTESQTGLTQDQTTLAGESVDIDTYLAEIQKIRDEIKKAQKGVEDAEKKVTVTLSGRRTRTMSATEAITRVRGDDNTVTVTIEGVQIKALDKQRDALKADRDKIYDEYRKEAVDTLKTSAERAQDTLDKAEEDLEEEQNKDPYNRNKVATLQGKVSRARERAQRTEDAYTAAQARAAEYYDELVRNPKDASLREKQASIDRQVALLDSASDAIKGKNETLEAQTKKLSSTDTSKRLETAQIFTAIPAALDELNTWTISRADLTNKTFDELLAQINQANGVSNSRGWPETGNTSPENRLMLLHAMAEARSYYEPAIQSPTADFIDATDETLWGLSEVDLITLSVDDIKKRMDARRSAIGNRPSFSVNRIRDTITEATKRQTARQRMLQRLKGDVDHRLAVVTTDSERLNSEGLPTPKADIILRAADRFTEINENITEYLPKDADIGRFLGNTTDTPGNRTPDIADIDPQVFYRNCLQELFDCRGDFKAYYKGETGPKAALALAMELVPFDTFSELLATEFDPPQGAGADRVQRIVQDFMRLDNIELRNRLASFHTNKLLYSHLPNIEVN